MAKEWILNSAMNRFQLNFKRNVGAVAEAIRQCAPTTIEEWQQYYFTQIRSREHIEELGRKLYVKVTEVIASEVEAVTEEDCIDYMIHMVVDRTFDGYVTEITTIYGQLQEELGVEIQASSDEWDRKYNVDFQIQLGKERYIGLQIKPVNNSSHIPEIYKERSIQATSHKAFTRKYKGRVFYVFSAKENGKKVILNREVIEEIRQEMELLGSL